MAGKWTSEPLSASAHREANYGLRKTRGCEMDRTIASRSMHVSPQHSFWLQLPLCNTSYSLTRTTRSAIASEATGDFLVQRGGEMMNVAGKAN